MPISALPESTVRLLGSGITIASPCDLVKELIDNAIDARATSIEVVISSDSVSQIIVRDDGHGIDVDDFESLGRRSHTSKLKSFDELKNRGGETLGFRGEALASANSVAAISITTRTGKDPVASRLRLKLGVGGVENLSKTSAPVGTIVQVSKLFENLPARKQYALRNGNKSMSKIKDLLKTYALAQPYLRLSLKVSDGGAKGAWKSTWSYNPNHSPTVHEAVLQIFRKDLASNCVHVSRRFGLDKLVPLHVKLPPAITVDAFIPAPGCSDKLVKGKGAHISVDSRPLSSSRGLPKKIISSFKSHLGEAMRSHGSSTSLANPFIQLNIVCPPCSYDSNVSPLKDEVIFADEARLLECFDNMFRTFYRVGNATGRAPHGAISHAMVSNIPLKLRIEQMNSTADAAKFSFIEDVADQTLVQGVKGNPVPFTSRQSKGANLPKDLSRETSENFFNPSQESKKCSSQSAKMRLPKAVSMARIKSDLSDDTAVGETLPVQIPPWSPLSERSPSKSKPRVNLKSPASNLTFENIERYFWPSRNKDFQIAEDRTATNGEQIAERSISSGIETERRALQELSESVINEIQGLEEPESNFVDVRTEGPQPRRAMRGTTRVPSLVRGPREMSSREVTRVPQGTPPQSSPQFHGQRGSQLSDVSSPRGVAHFGGIRTPPPSDPPVGLRNPNPPFQPHRRNAQPRRSHRDISGNLFGMESPIPRRISLGQMNDRNSLPEQLILPGATRRPMLIGDLLNTNTEAPSYTIPSRPQRPSADFSNASSLFPMSSRNSRPSKDYGERNAGQRNQQHSFTQPHPLRNQAFNSLKRKASNAAWTDDPPRHEAEELASEALRRISQEHNRYSASEVDATFGPGHLPGQELCSQPRSTHLSHLSLSFAPEVTDENMKTQALSKDLSLGPEDIERCRQLFAKWEPYVSSDKSEASLPFRTMEEIRMIEQGLRKTVDAWMKKTDGEFTVEYTLRSTAKGKRVG